MELLRDLTPDVEAFDGREATVEALSWSWEHWDRSRRRALGAIDVASHSRRRASCSWSGSWARSSRSAAPGQPTHRQQPPAPRPHRCAVVGCSPVPHDKQHNCRRVAARDAAAPSQPHCATVTSTNTPKAAPPAPSTVIPDATATTARKTVDTPPFATHEPAESPNGTNGTPMNPAGPETPNADPDPS